MDVDRLLSITLKLELSSLIGLLAALSFVPHSSPWMYELSGALTAASITTFGLHKMKNLTE